MSQAPVVSIIVPAYNAAAVLDMALASASAQTLADLEVLVVDDGSTDDTWQIACRWAQRDPRFIPIQHTANAGLPTTRNTALARARGEWIAFLDADDVWFPGKTAAQLELAQQDARTNLLFANYWIWDGQRDLHLRYGKRRHFPEGAPVAQLCRGCVLGISSVMVRRQVLDRVGAFDPNLLGVADWDLWLRIAEAGLWARGVWEPQLRYRVWAGNMSKNAVRMATEAVWTLEKAMARGQPADRRRHYERSLQVARGNLELARVLPLLPAQPEAVAGGVLRAWRHCPRKARWLLWYLALKWPAVLGGRLTTSRVHRKLGGE